MKIKRIHISNYKSYSPEGETISLSDVTGFIGPNSAGKTNVLEALQIFFFPAKLDASSFHKKNIETPISIDVTFDEISSVNSLEEKVLLADGQLTLRRIYTWNSVKGAAEASKDLLPGAMWVFCGNQDILNPFPGNKPTASDIRTFLSSPNGHRFREKTNTPANATQAIFAQNLVNFWISVSKNSSEWKSNFEWKCLDFSFTPHKGLHDFIDGIRFPYFIYLPTDYSVSDELSLKKGSRLDLLFSSLLKSADSRSSKQNKAIQKIGAQIEKYYSIYFDKRLETFNANLNSSSIQWNFSNSHLKIERIDQAIENTLQPTWQLIVDDGFSSEISSKGNGMQRLALLQLLQAYIDSQIKSSNLTQIILAIEEPELYLHPPYKRALYNAFRRLGSSFQVFYTTHDPAFIRLEYFDEIRLVRKNPSHESIVNSVGWSIFDKNKLWKDIFGRLKTEESRRNELYNKCHGEQDEGFFAEKVILVEGNTERYALPIYFQKLQFDLDKENIALIEAGSVDAIKAVHAIFSAFGIPVYVIFDGDKPKEKEYEEYIKIVHFGKKRYYKFAQLLEKYISDDPDVTIQTIRSAYAKVSSVIPQEFLAVLNDVQCSKNQITSFYKEKMLSIGKVEEFEKKHNRDKDLQAYLGDTSAAGFSQTMIKPHFTMWEYNFEENISKDLKNYKELHDKATSTCSGKPLIAKLIAQNATVNDFNDDLAHNLNCVIDAIKQLTLPVTIPAATQPIETATEFYTIQLLMYPQENALKVFSCAGGPFNPEAEDPIEYAQGRYPSDTSYVIKISGNSMEPKIMDGSYLAIAKKESDDPKQNSIGVFCLNGQSICKKYVRGKDSKVRLVSINPSVETIEVKEDDRLDYYGQVICGKNKEPIILRATSS